MEFIFLNPTNNLFNIKPLHDSIINILPINEIKTEIYSNSLSKSIFDAQINKTILEHTKQIVSEYKPESALKILVNSENTQRIKTAYMIKKSLSDYGINSIIEKKDFPEYKIAIQNRNFDICIAAFNSSQKFYYKNLFSNENILSYKNENIHEKWLKINSAIDKNEFDTAIQDFNTALKDSNFIILGFKNKFYISNIS